MNALFYSFYLSSNLDNSQEHVIIKQCTSGYDSYRFQKNGYDEITKYKFSFPISYIKVVSEIILNVARDGANEEPVQRRRNRPDKKKKMNKNRTGVAPWKGLAFINQSPLRLRIWHVIYRAASGSPPLSHLLKVFQDDGAFRSVA